MKKKLIAVLLVVTMICAMGAPVLAAPSPESVIPKPVEEGLIINALSNSPDAEAARNAVTTVADPSNVVALFNVENTHITNGVVTLRDFALAGTSYKAYAFKDGKWTELKVEIIGTNLRLSGHFCPVLIVADGAVAPKGSPSTGSDYTALFAVLGMMAVAGTLFVAKKRLN